MNEAAANENVKYVVDRVATGLEALGAKMGVSADYLIGVYAHKVYVHGIISLVIWGLLLVVLGVVTAKLVKYAGKCAQKDLPHYSTGEEEASFIVALVSCVALLIMTCVILANVSDWITMITDSEYWAYRRLAEDVGQIVAGLK